MRNLSSGPFQAGFTLLPVILTMTLIAAIAFLLNRDNGMNAEMIASQANVDRARFAAEAGLQAANFVIQGKSCTGTFPVAAAPVVNSNFSGASYSAYADKASGASVTLTSTGSFNGASVTLTRPGVYVYQAGLQTYTLQPGRAASENTSVDKKQQSSNFGLGTLLKVVKDSFETMIQFNLSALPPGSRPVTWYDSVLGKLQPGATLSLYQPQTDTASKPDPIEAYLISQSWVEGTSAANSGATWTTYDGVNRWRTAGQGYANSTPVSSATYSLLPAWIDWDVTAAASRWLSGAYPNYGVWLRTEGNVKNGQFVSSDSATASQRPKLTLRYLLACNQTAPTSSSPLVTVTLAPIGDADIDGAQNQQSLNFGGNPAMNVFYASPASQNRSLIEFDTSGIPPGVTIVSATLRAYVTGISKASSTAKTISAYALTESWVAGTGSGKGFPNGVTYATRNGLWPWTSAGGTYRSSAVALALDETTGLSPPPSAFTKGWLAWDLRALTQEWVDNITANNGVILISTIKDQFAFATSEASTNPPQLVITYQ